MSPRPLREQKRVLQPIELRRHAESAARSLGQNPLLWHKSPAGLCAHRAFRDIARKKKRYSIFPSYEVKISCYFKPPHPPLYVCRIGTNAKPPPLEGRGLHKISLPAGNIAGGGVIDDSIHIFRRRKIWIPFCMSIRLATKVEIKLHALMLRLRRRRL